MVGRGAGRGKTKGGAQPFQFAYPGPRKVSSVPGVVDGATSGSQSNSPPSPQISRSLGKGTLLSAAPCPTVQGPLCAPAPVLEYANPPSQYASTQNSRHPPLLSPQHSPEAPRYTTSPASDYPNNHSRVMTPPYVPPLTPNHITGAAPVFNANQTPFLQQPQLSPSTQSPRPPTATFQSSRPSAVQSPRVQSPRPSAVQTPQPPVIQSPLPPAVQSPQHGTVRSPQPAAVRSPQPAAVQSPQPAAVQSPPSAQASASTLPELADEPCAVHMRNARGRGRGTRAPANREKREVISVTDQGEFSSEKVSRTISANLKTYLQDVYLNYGAWSIEYKTQLWLAFTDVYMWDEEYHGRVVALYNHHCHQKFTHELSSAKYNYYKGEVDPEHKRIHKVWIPPRLIPGYVAKWETPEVKARSLQAQLNRNEGDKVTHRGGSVSIEGLRARKAKVKNVDIELITIPEVYKESRQHVDTNGNLVWVNEVSKLQWDGYHNLLRATYGDPVDWPKFDAMLWGKAAEQLNKNGRVSGIPVCSHPTNYGMSVGKRKRDEAASYQCSPLTIELKGMVETYKERVDRLNDEIKANQAQAEAMQARMEANQARLINMYQALAREVQMSRGLGTHSESTIPHTFPQTQPLGDVGYSPEPFEHQDEGEQPQQRDMAQSDGWAAIANLASQMLE